MPRNIKNILKISEKWKNIFSVLKNIAHQNVRKIGLKT